MLELWTQKQSAIAWRGESLEQGHSVTTRLKGIWESIVGSSPLSNPPGPGFRMMQLWNGRQVHPIAPDVAVEVDFAFTEETRMSNKRKPADGDFRIAPSLSYQELQEYKYLMDIDEHDGLYCELILKCHCNSTWTFLLLTSPTLCTAESVATAMQKLCQNTFWS